MRFNYGHRFVRIPSLSLSLSSGKRMLINCPIPKGKHTRARKVPKVWHIPVGPEEGNAQPKFGYRIRKSELLFQLEYSVNTINLIAITPILWLKCPSLLVIFLTPTKLLIIFIRLKLPIIALSLSLSLDGFRKFFLPSRQCVLNEIIFNKP